MPERAARAETLRASSPRADLLARGGLRRPAADDRAARRGAGDPQLLDRLPVLRLPREARGRRLLEAGEAVQEVLLAVREGDEDARRAVVGDDGGPVGRGEARDEVAQALDDGVALLGKEAIVVEVDEELPRDVRLAAVGLQRVEDEVGGRGRQVRTVDRPGLDPGEVVDRDRLAVDPDDELLPRQVVHRAAVLRRHDVEVHGRHLDGRAHARLGVRAGRRGRTRDRRPRESSARANIEKARADDHV